MNNSDHSTLALWLVVRILVHKRGLYTGSGRDLSRSRVYCIICQRMCWNIGLWTSLMQLLRLIGLCQSNRTFLYILCMPNAHVRCLNWRSGWGQGTHLNGWNSPFWLIRDWAALPWYDWSEHLCFHSNVIMSECLAVSTSVTIQFEAQLAIA